MKNNQPKRLLILSCSARKADGKGLAAIDRYNSPAFFLLRRFLRSHPETAPVVWIVSAKYGLIGTSQKTKLYDQPMTSARANQLKNRFVEQYSSLYNASFMRHAPLEVFCHLPENYRAAIQAQTDRLAQYTRVRFALGRPGEKLRELKLWLEEIEEKIQI